MRECNYFGSQENDAVLGVGAARLVVVPICELERLAAQPLRELRA